MISTLFPRAHARYTSLPILGGPLEQLCDWLHEKGYPRRSIQGRMQAASWLERILRRRDVLSLSDLTIEELLAFAPNRAGSKSRVRGALVRSLAQYMSEQGCLAPSRMGLTQARVVTYRQYLEHVRGLSAGTVGAHASVVTRFLDFIDYDSSPERISELSSAEVDAFVSKTSERVSRGAVGNTTCALRAFLRYLAAVGDGPPGLHTLVVAPRVPGDTELPRTLPWTAVVALLRAIDRETSKGKRDYAAFLLIATYGLRTSEVRALRLDDISWRAGHIRVPQPKTGRCLPLPMTDEVATALLDYLRRGRPPTRHRHVFLRVEAPVGPLGKCALVAAFRVWSRRAGIEVPPRGGPHSLRHTRALQMLRDGTALKTIGDILGHRNSESTGVYLRLDIDDLRDVALSLPSACEPQEVRP